MTEAFIVLLVVKIKSFDSPSFIAAVGTRSVALQKTLLSEFLC